MPKKVKKCVMLDEFAAAEIKARCAISRRTFSAELDFAILEYRSLNAGGTHPNDTDPGNHTNNKSS
jgi:hypothetical protein